MVRGSTYSAVLHLSIVAAILFGLPSLTLIWPEWPKEEIEEPIVPVVVMSEQQAAALVQKSDQAGKNKPQPKSENTEAKSSPSTASADTSAAPAKASTPSEEKKEEKPTEEAQQSRPKPKPAALPGGGMSVVTNANQDDEGEDDRSTTRNPTKEKEEGAPQGAVADNVQIAKAAESTPTPPNSSQPQKNSAAAQKNLDPARFSLVTRPMNELAPSQAAESERTSSEASDKPASAPSRAETRDQKKTAAAKATAESTAELEKNRAASEAMPAQDQKEIAEQADPSAASADNVAMVIIDPISTIMTEMAQKIPRLQSLREQLENPHKEEDKNPAIVQSAKRMEQRAEEGYTHAQFSLAEMYLTGEGVKKDSQKAVELLKRAAISGYLPAQLTMAMLAAEGQGMERSLAEAHTWLKVAAEQGNKAAQEALPKIEKRMATKDTVEARVKSQQLHQVLVMIHGSPVNKTSKSESNERLRVAAALGDVESVHVLLAQGADADNPDLDGRTAVIEAAWRGYPRIVKSLVDNGAKLDATDNTGKNAIMWAAINGHAKVIDNLVGAGSPVNDKDNEGMTALMRAAWNGHVDAVKALLKANADAGLADKKGQRAIDYARKSNRSQVVRILTAARK